MLRCSGAWVSCHCRSGAPPRPGIAIFCRCIGVLVLWCCSLPVNLYRVPCLVLRLCLCLPLSCCFKVPVFPVMYAFQPRYDSQSRPAQVGCGSRADKAKSGRDYQAARMQCGVGEQLATLLLLMHINHMNRRFLSHWSLFRNRHKDAAGPGSSLWCLKRICRCKHFSICLDCTILQRRSTSLARCGADTFQETKCICLLLASPVGCRKHTIRCLQEVSSP